MIGERILVVAAHPDDEVLGCGGTIARYRQAGAAVRIVFLGEGSTARFTRDRLACAEALAAIADRTKSGMQAASVLGVDEPVFHNLPCVRFDTLPIIDIGKIVESEIQAFQPDTILTHTDIDTNMDHRLTLQACLQATRPGANNAVANLLSFEVQSSTEWRFTDQFRPGVFVDIGATLETKLQAMAAYESEVRPYPFPRSREGITAQAMVRGMQAGIEYAEAFQLVRSIIR